MAAGQLVYGHFGRFEDLTTLQRLHGLEFNNSVVMIKVNNHYHTGSMVRNAQMLGARAVILFPDPFPYILSKVIYLGVLSTGRCGSICGTRTKTVPLS